MKFVELFLLAVALSMDAFAVSVCKGLSVQKTEKKHYLLIGLWFGGFQTLMFTLGYLLAHSFEKYITAFDHWIAFALLALIGANMLKEAFEKEKGDDESPEKDASFAWKHMLVLAIATSIDAMATGIVHAMNSNISILIAAPLIGVITFAFSAVGLKIGNVFGLKYKKGAEITGGVILILMGIKILLEHLGVIHF